MNDYQNQVGNIHDLLDVLIVFREKLLKDINVATLAFYKKRVEEYTSTKKYGIIEVAPFPLTESETENTITVYHFTDVEFNENDIVIILFMDTNFIQNLKK